MSKEILMNKAGLIRNESLSQIEDVATIYNTHLADAKKGEGSLKKRIDQIDDQILAIKLRLADISEELIRSKEEKKKAAEENTKGFHKRLSRAKQSKSVDPPSPSSDPTPEQTTPV